MAILIRNVGTSVLSLPDDLAGGALLGTGDAVVVPRTKQQVIDSFKGHFPAFHLKLTFVPDAQATEAFTAQDYQNSVLDLNLAAPPASPTIGARYIVNGDGGPAATGAWAGQDNNFAEWNGTAWEFEAVTEGAQTWVEDENLYYQFNGASWIAGAAPALHAATHLPGGADALTTAAPDTNLSPATANGVGAAASFARSNHTHGVVTALIGDIAAVDGAVAAAGVANTFARGDHKHGLPVAAAPADVDGAVAAAGVSTNIARTDHKHSLPAAVAPENVTKAAAVAGVSTNVARADHKHDATTAAPATTLSPATTNAEGAATGLSRSDHGHAVATALVGAIAAVDGAAAGAGVADTFARGDHKHSLPGAVAPADVDGAVAAAGVSTNVARSDHKHSLPAAVAPENVTKAAAVAGASANVARADHKHDVTTAAAGGLTSASASAEGAAASLARSDHSHAVTALDGRSAGNVANDNLIGGVPVLHKFVIPAGITGDVDFVLTHKTELVDVTLKKTVAAGGGAGTIQLQTGAAVAISNAMSIDVADQTVIRAGTLDDATHEIAAGGTLRFRRTRTASTDESCLAYVQGIRRA